MEKNLQKIAKGFIIKDYEDQTKAEQILKDVKAMQKKIKGSYEPTKKQLNETLKTLREEMKTQLKPWEDVEAVMKKKMGAFELEQMRIREAEEKKRTEAAAKKINDSIEKGEVPEFPAPAELKPERPETTGKTSYIKKLKIRVVDISKVPEEFIIRSADMVKLNAQLKITGKDTKIPGTEIEEIVETRQRT